MTERLTVKFGCETGCSSAPPLLNRPSASNHLAQKSDAYGLNTNNPSGHEFTRSSRVLAFLACDPGQMHPGARAGGERKAAVF